MNREGSFTENSNETLEQLMKKHFQVCKDDAKEKSKEKKFSPPSIPIS